MSSVCNEVVKQDIVLLKSQTLFEGKHDGDGAIVFEVCLQGKECLVYEKAG